MPRTYLQFSVRRLQDKVAPTLHRAAHSRGQEGPCLHAQPSAQVVLPPVLNARLLKPYLDPSLVRLEALEPPKVDVPRLITPAPGYQATPPNKFFFILLQD